MKFTQKVKYKIDNYINNLKIEPMNRIRLVTYWEDVIIRKHIFEEIDEDDNVIRESEVLNKEEVEVVDSGVINTVLETEIDSIFFKDKLKKFKDENSK